jgi:hypothetical protein
MKWAGGLLNFNPDQMSRRGADFRYQMNDGDRKLLDVNSHFWTCKIVAYIVGPIHVLKPQIIDSTRTRK